MVKQKGGRRKKKEASSVFLFFSWTENAECPDPRLRVVVASSMVQYVRVRLRNIHTSHGTHVPCPSFFSG